MDSLDRLGELVARQRREIAAEQRRGGLLLLLVMALTLFTVITAAMGLSLAVGPLSIATMVAALLGIFYLLVTLRRDSRRWEERMELIREIDMFMFTPSPLEEEWRGRNRNVS